MTKTMLGYDEEGMKQGRKNLKGFFKAVGIIFIILFILGVLFL